MSFHFARGCVCVCVRVRACVRVGGGGVLTEWNLVMECAGCVGSQMFMAHMIYQNMCEI
jgi:hypothetical protein